MTRAGADKLYSASMRKRAKVGRRSLKLLALMYDSSTDLMSSSVSPVNFSNGQYSQICESQRVPRTFAAFTSSGGTNALKLLL